MNYRYIFLLSFFVVCLACAKNVEYADIYLNQASSDLVNLVDEVAQEVGYHGNYELVEPNKIGLQINPWNTMIAYSVNDLTKNNLIVINPPWFNELPKDEQKFLIGLCLTKFEQGILPASIKVVSYCFTFLMLLLFPTIFWLIGRTNLRKRNFWVRIGLAYVMAVSLNYTVLHKLQLAVVHYACFKYEVKVNRLTLTKLPNKLAAISALNRLDAAIKDGIKAGHNCFKSSENIFANVVKDFQC